MAVILRILHLQFDLVPTECTGVDEVKLYQMAIICDKYDMKRALGYWFKQWAVKEGGIVEIDAQSAPKYLFMAYAFGHEAMFTQLSRELMLRYKVTDDGSLALPGTKHPIFDDCFVPDIVVGRCCPHRPHFL